ncbi:MULTISPECIES: response regulator [Rhizobiaceae]|jgi:DNA-binding response OmpR family regulator|uniref:Regulatory protein VirG n=2 Tax=Rhizobiaceae TaxID=82115 RepID=A0A7W6TJX9_9HYPH|nr:MULTISPECIES: response regulator [Rhizobium/Agrobacterium group]MBB4350885.1 two-component system phosphate regulon response regulator OmpR [Rhizobium cellulosilyticum]MBB4414128.1 two-component system phosphate regulon response regulator OmpR [Rhizobium cellulosilyticum]MBB4448743.1 two-component system phosphate regulon response regulator OmpR [Rhizobium cellulosilyticum]MBB6164371.1 two-component system phosphate regulon response regulator OmpR [Rhizobium wenxiniae]MBO0143937.1 response 
MSIDPAHAAHILVVDDDPRIRQMLSRYFEGEGYRVTTVPDGVEMNVAMRQNSIDAVLLDLSLPGGRDGLDLARDIRAKSDVPIMMLTGRDDVVDRIIGIEIGADDYIAKPFHLREVHARLKSILRRRQPATPRVVQEEDQVIRFEGWALNISRRQLLDPAGAEIELTTGEFDMLAAFLNHAGRVLTRDFLMDMTRGRQLEAFDRTIDAQIVRLRRKIEADVKHPQFIKAIRGVGYIFTGKIG